MAERHIIRRGGTEAEVAAFVGALGEHSFDEGKGVLIMHDGSTPGGIPHARADLQNVTIIKAPAQLTTTENITLSGLQIIDSRIGAANDRVLVKDQTVASENGIYDMASGAWPRSKDFDADADVTSGLIVAVWGGTRKGDTVWMLTTDDPITLGTNALAFAQVGGQFPVETKTAAYTVVKADFGKLFLTDGSGGAFTITLLPVATAGEGFTVSFVQIANGTVFIDADGSEVINNVLQLKMVQRDQGFQLRCDGAKWWTVGSTYGQPLGSGRQYLENVVNEVPKFVAARMRDLLERTNTADATISIVDAGRMEIANKATPITLTLTAAGVVFPGWLVFFKNIGVGTLTIDPNGAETIDGNANMTLEQNEWTLVWTDGSNWRSFGAMAVGAGGDTHPVDDTTSLVKDPADNTKQARIDVGAVAAGVTRVITVPDQDIDLTPGTGSFATEAEGNLAATALQNLIDDPTPDLGGPLNGLDQPVSRVNLKDYGEITNAIGGIGGGTQDIDLTLGNVITATVDVAATTFTFSNPTAGDEGSSFTLILTNGGSQTITWPASVTWITNGGSPPVLQSSGVDILVFMTVDGGVTWFGYGPGVSERSIHNTHAKIGATAGWVVDAADDIGLLAACPASQTASTLVVPIAGLKVGDTITAFSVVGQIESAGGTVTLDADLRKHTAAAADVTDASVGAITQISETADAIISAQKTGLAEVVAADETFYVLLTATTAAATDIALQGVTITVTKA